MSFAFPLVTTTKTILIHMAPGMPPSYWWVTALVMGILILTATIDAFTARIPDILILLGLLAVAVTQGLVSSWSVAALHFYYALIAGALIWTINFIWYNFLRYDALGMGDAKWTMLAIACFGVIPALYAWGLGAILASVFILAARSTGYQTTRVTFGPFLLVGLCVGLYLIRLTSL